MKTTMTSFQSRLPKALHPVVDKVEPDWRQACRSVAGETPCHDDPASLGYAWACSDFIARYSCRFPEDFMRLFDEGVRSPRRIGDYLRRLDPVFHERADISACSQALRRFRQREMCRIAWRDLLQLAPAEQIFFELTDLAEAIVVRSVEYLERSQAAIYGQPVDAGGRPMHLLVMAMGKMGGRELNFSSDIDLVFCYAEDGETTGPRKISHHEYFLVIARKLIAMLSEVTGDGFVFRVDTRLRPNGKSGPLVACFNAMELYYQHQGRNWERYAMVKCRIVTGSAEHRRQLESILRPFVYRRYLDYNAFDSIREMKAMIASQVKRKGMRGNIKLGAGGIREIEFIAQTFQLLRGGREPELRRRSVVAILKLLAEKSYLDAGESDDLIEAYWFLRKLENRLQILNDQQVHALPGDALAQARIALAMAMPDWDTLLSRLQHYRQQVGRVFDSLFADPAGDGDETRDERALLRFFLQEDGDDDELRDILAATGFDDLAEDPDAPALLASLRQLPQAGAIKRLSDEQSRRFFQLLASLAGQSAGFPAPTVLFQRVLRVLQVIAGRAVYISMLLQYPPLQRQLLRVCQAGAWFADAIARSPLLLDELLNRTGLHERKPDLRSQLRNQLARIDMPVEGEADSALEEIMERLRQFRQQSVFSTAVLDVLHELPIDEVDQRLSLTAEVVLEAVLNMAWDAMVQKYGEPHCRLSGRRYRPAMSIVGYGKLGGREMGYGSDLDIIFLHDSAGADQFTSGDKPIDNQRFFARVAQRVIHILGTRTYAGALYETDTRLRPDGRSGMLVSSLNAFEAYQRDKAWLWEHQALIRARFICGNAHVEQEFGRIRHQTLTQRRDRAEVVAEVVTMRQKMRQHLASTDGGIDIKHDAGGLVDIEFLVQAGVLIHARRQPGLVARTATLSLIDALQAAGWFEVDEARELQAAYRFMRRWKNHRDLGCEPDGETLASHRQRVVRCWGRLLETA